MNYESLIETLEKSVKKQGEQPLTNRWLLNLVKITQKKEESELNDMLYWCDIEDTY